MEMIEQTGLNAVRPDGCQRGACTDHISQLKGYCCVFKF